MSPQSADETPPIAGWRVAGASVAGTAHARANVPCQDAHRWTVLPNGCLVVAVADGAGSAARSEEGAQIAVEAAQAFLACALEGDLPAEEEGWHDVIAEALAAAFAAIDAHADDTTASLRDFATTLTVVAATEEHLAVGQIGDGIVVAEGDDGLFLAAAPQRGEYANEVALLTSRQSVAGAAIASFQTSTRSVAVITDGLLRLAVRLPSHEPHAPFFHPLFAFVSETADAAAACAELGRFLASERITERTDDDKTLVLAIYTAIAESANPSVMVPFEASQAG